MPQVEKILKDIQGPALALVLERLKPSESLQGVYIDCLALLYYVYDASN